MPLIGGAVRVARARTTWDNGTRRTGVGAHSIAGIVDHGINRRIETALVNGFLGRFAVGARCEQANDKSDCK